MKKRAGGADFALEPKILADRPELDRLLREAGFEREENKPGAWIATTTIAGREVSVPVDLMVPDAAAPPGSRRAVDLPGHDRMATRRAIGLEASLVDNDLQLIAALDPGDRARLQGLDLGVGIGGRRGHGASDQHGGEPDPGQQDRRLGNMHLEKPHAV